MKIAIVGHEDKKFTPAGRRLAIKAILDMFERFDPEFVISGACPLGGIDIYAEQLAKLCNIPTIIHRPMINKWEQEGFYGFKDRNLDIAKDCDVIVCIAVDKLPNEFKGLTHDVCYHCTNNGDEGKDHVKGGGCWTMWKAKKFGKEGLLYIIPQNPE